MKNLISKLPEEELDQIDLFGISISTRTTKGGKIYSATARIHINNEAVPTKHPVDFSQLVKSLKSPGSHYIFTCGCGSAGCAGIEDGVEVEHDQNVITWRFRLPQSTDGFRSHEVWHAVSDLHIAVFEKEQIVSEVVRALEEMKNTHDKDTEYAPEGFDRNAILKLINALN
jgi:hypothetical protein